MNPIEIIFRGKDETRPATESVKKGLDGVQESAKKTGTAFDTAMGVLAATQIERFGNTVSSFMNDSINEAAEMQDAMVQITQVLESTGKASIITADEVENMANAFSRVSVYEDDMVASGQLVLLQFDTIGKETLPRATQAMLDLATRMNIDLPSAAKVVGKALEGELGSLTRFGIVLDDSTKKQIEGLLQVGETAKAQELILAEFEKKFGGAAEAATTTWTGAMANLEKSIANLKGSFGEAILNSESVSAAINHIADAINWLAESFDKMPEGLKLIVAGFVGLIALLGKLAPVLISIKVLAGAGGVAGAMTALKGVLAGIGAVLAGISAPVWLLIAAISALVVTIIVFGKDAWNTMTMLDAIFKAVINRIIFELLKLSSSFAKVVTDAFNKAIQIGSNIVKGIWEGIQSGWAWLVNMVRTNIDNLLLSIKSLLGISSPSKVFMGIGKNMALGIGAGFADGMKAIKPEINMLTPKMQPVFAQAGRQSGGGNITGTFQFYSSLTMEERRKLRVDSQRIAQRELLRSLR